MPNKQGYSGVKPKPSKNLFSTSIFTSTLLNGFVLEHRDLKTKKLRSVLVKLLNSTELKLKWLRLYFFKHCDPCLSIQGRVSTNQERVTYIWL